MIFGMRERRYYELKGRLWEICEEKAEILNSISVAKNTLMDLLKDENNDNKLFIGLWELNENKLRRLYYELKELEKQEEVFKQELQKD